jgi:cytochrome P450 family 110
LVPPRAVVSGVALAGFSESGALIRMSSVQSPLRPLRGPRFRTLQTLRYLRDPLTWYGRWLTRHGDPCILPLRHGRMLLTADPALIGEVFAARPETFGVMGADVVALLEGRLSLFVATGRVYEMGRKLLVPQLHGAAMRLRVACTTEVVHETFAGLRPGRSFCALDLSQRISLEVILRMLVGSERQSRREALASAVHANYSARTPPVFIRHLRRDFGGFGPYARLKRTFQALDAMLYELIAERRSSKERRDDLLDVLVHAQGEDGIPLGDEYIRDNLLSLVGAGYESTALNLAWALYFLNRQREHLDRARVEIGDDGGGSQRPISPFLEAVCNESLRLYPALPEVTRLVELPFDLGGHRLLPGDGIIVAITEVHRRKSLYPDPERFEPARFLERRFSPNEFLPFGGGHRRCVGSQTALHEMQLALAAIVGGYDLRVASATPPPLRRHSHLIVPKGGIPMIYQGPRDS